MNWNEITDIADISAIKSASSEVPCLIFKHSTRCSISSMAKMRLEKNWQISLDTIQPYHLDLIEYRSISTAIAEEFQVHHESPQVLLIQNGECIYDDSHLDISVENILEALMQTK